VHGALPAIRDLLPGPDLLPTEVAQQEGNEPTLVFGGFGETP